MKEQRNEVTVSEAGHRETGSKRARRQLQSNQSNSFMKLNERLIDFVPSEGMRPQGRMKQGASRAPVRKGTKERIEAACTIKAAFIGHSVHRWVRGLEGWRGPGPKAGWYPETIEEHWTHTYWLGRRKMEDLAVDQNESFLPCLHLLRARKSTHTHK